MHFFRPIDTLFRLLAGIFLGLVLCSHTFSAPLTVQPGDVLVITGANEIWRLPLGDTGGIGEFLLAPPVNNELWGITVDKNLNLYYVSRDLSADNHVVRRLNQAGSVETVATLPLPGTQYFVEDIASGPTNDVYIAFRSRTSSATWIAEVKPNGDATDLSTGQKLMGPFTSPSFSAGFGASLAVNSKDDVLVLADNLGNDVVYLAPPGAPVLALGTFNNGEEIAFTSGDMLWGSIPRSFNFNPPAGTSELFNIKLPASVPPGPPQPLMVESGGIIPFYGALDYDGEFLVGNGQEQLIYMGPGPGIVKWDPVAWRDSRSRDGRNQTVAQRIFLPQIADFIDVTQGGAVVKDPISTRAGEFFDEIEDLTLRSLLPISFRRFYCSTLASEGQVRSALGANWTHNFELRIDVTADLAKVVYHRGATISFRPSGNRWLLASATQLAYQLVQEGNLYRLLDPETQLIYTFNSQSAGRLERISDRNENTQALTYSGSNLSKVDDGLGSSLEFTYTDGKLTRVQDHSGREVTFSYSGADLKTVTDVEGKTTTYNYTASGGRSGLLLSVQRPEANVPVTQSYDDKGRVTSQVDGAGNTTRLAYDTPAAGQTTVTDALGKNATFKYVNGLLTEQRDEQGAPTALSYDSRRRRTLHADRLAKTTSFTYHSPSGLIESVTYPDGAKIFRVLNSVSASGITFYDVARINYPDGTFSSFEYDSKGNVTSATDRAGHKWLFTYNSRGQLLTWTTPAGAVSTMSYNADGTKASLQFTGSGTTTFTYDALKRITSKKEPDGTTRTYTYDKSGRVLSETDEAGSTTRRAYNGNGLLSRYVDPSGGALSYSYDANDDAIEIRDQLDQLTKLSYDPLNRAKTVTLPDGTTIGFGYDEVDNLTSLTDGEGKVTAFGYDRNRRLISRTDPAGNTTRATRTDKGQIDTLTTPLGNKTTFSYDSVDRLVSTTDPLGGVSRFTYDGRGDLASFRLPNGTSASYARNALGEIAEVTDSNGNKWRYAHDSAGRLISATDPLGNTESYTRDNQGRITRVDLPGGNIQVTTDAVGRLRRSVFSDGVTLDYSYDARGLLTSGNGVELQYDARGDLVFSNGVRSERDSTGQLSKVTLATGKAVSYQYDRRGLLTEMRDWIGGSTTFSYDAAGRLLTISRPNGVVTRYSHDADGNLASVADSRSSVLASTTLVWNAKGEVVQAERPGPPPPPSQLAAGEGSRTFDAASQIVGFSYDGLGRRTGDSKRTYVWDLASRLRRFTQGAESVDFTYDVFGLVLSESRAGRNRQVVWNYATELSSPAVVRQDGSDLRYYIYTPGGDLLESVEAASGARSFYHFDEMGNTLLLTNEAGAVTDTYSYSPYGTILSRTGNSDNPFTFAGRFGVLTVEGSGLYSMRARFYDASTQAFITRDPVSRVGPAQLNPYQYAAGNPLLFVDVTGALGRKPDAEKPLPPALEASKAVKEGFSSATDAKDVAELALKGVKKLGGGKVVKSAEELEKLAKAVLRFAKSVDDVEDAIKLTKAAEGLKGLEKVGKVVEYADNVVTVGEFLYVTYKYYQADQETVRDTADARSAAFALFAQNVRNITNSRDKKLIDFKTYESRIRDVNQKLKTDQENETSLSIINKKINATNFAIEGGKILVPFGDQVVSFLIFLFGR